MNIVNAICNLVKNPQYKLKQYTSSRNRANGMGEALEEYIKGEAKIRALKAMKHVIENGTIETQASETLEQEEEISRRATNMVKNSEYEPEFEKAVNQKILNDFRETKNRSGHCHRSVYFNYQRHYRYASLHGHHRTAFLKKAMDLAKKGKEKI